MASGVGADCGGFAEKKAKMRGVAMQWAPEGNEWRIQTHQAYGASRANAGRPDADAIRRTHIFFLLMSMDAKTVHHDLDSSCLLPSLPHTYWFFQPVLQQPPYPRTVRIHPTQSPLHPSMAVAAAQYSLCEAGVGDMVAEYLEVPPAARISLYFLGFFYTLFSLSPSHQKQS